MTTLPTYAECAAKSLEKRTALEHFIYGHAAISPNDAYIDLFRDQLTAVIEEERAKLLTLRNAFNAFKDQQNGRALVGDASYDALAAENERLRELLRDACDYIEADASDQPYELLRDSKMALAKGPTT